MATAGLMSLELLMYPALIGFWAYAVHLVNMASRELYGSEFTTVVPHFLAANVLILIVVAAFPLHIVIGGGADVSVAFIYGMTAVQAVAGVLYAQGMYKTYNILFATQGFLIDEDGEVMN